MTSTRLPGKVLLKVNEKTMLQHHVDRLQSCGLNVVIATTTNPTDDPLIEFAHEFGIKSYRGDENNVLSRFVGAAEAFDLDTVVRVTSDCPLIDGAIIRDALTKFTALDNPWLYLSNTQSRTFPRGFDFEIFSTKALHSANRNAKTVAEREHVTPYFYAGIDPRIIVAQIQRDDDASSFRVTLDTPEDFDLISRLITEHRAAELDSDEIIEVLRENPDLLKINSHVNQKHLNE